MFVVVSDSSSLYSAMQARERGFYVLPLFVQADEQCYRDLEDIDAGSFSALTAKAAHLSTSQPSIGEKLEVYEQILQEKDCDILDVCISSSLSGTYQAALVARAACSKPERVYVFDCGTLCGPQQRMVDYACLRARQKADVQDVLCELEAAKERMASTLCVLDLLHLVRGGRLSRSAGMVGSLLKIMPVAVIGADGKLILQGKARTWQKAFEIQKRFLVSKGMDESWALYICHGNNPKAALKAQAYFQERFPGLTIIIHPLSAMFMVHGGEGCLSIQAISLPLEEGLSSGVYSNHLAETSALSAGA